METSLNSPAEDPSLPRGDLDVLESSGPRCVTALCTHVVPCPRFPSPHSLSFCKLGTGFTVQALSQALLLSFQKTRHQVPLWNHDPTRHCTQSPPPSPHQGPEMQGKARSPYEGWGLSYMSLSVEHGVGVEVSSSHFGESFRFQWPQWPSRGATQVCYSFECILPPTPALYLRYLLGLGGKVISKTVSYSDLVSSGWEFAVSNL